MLHRIIETDSLLAKVDIIDSRYNVIDKEDGKVRGYLHIDKGIGFFSTEYSMNTYTMKLVTELINKMEEAYGFQD